MKEDKKLKTKIEKQVKQNVKGIKNSTQWEWILTHSKWLTNKDKECPKVNKLTHKRSLRQFLKANGRERATRK